AHTRFPSRRLQSSQPHRSHRAIGFIPLGASARGGNAMTFAARKAKRIPRRALLRGAGIALGLPWLEAMLPSDARAQSVGAPSRALFVYFPTGYRVGGWLKASPGVYQDFAFPAIAQALAPFKSQLSLITGAGNAPAAFG